ncbi:MAG: hypothetical protein ALAOOOJD_02140 [bacterium]|nr:hypothetical protein [bacterium]
MKKIFILLIAASLAALGGCDSNSPLWPKNELLVVRAYLYAGESITDVQVTTTFGLAAAASTGLPINDAAVTLEKAGKIYPLSASRGDSGYYHYAGNDLAVNVGDAFKIRVAHYGQTATAETVIPAPPRQLVISKNEWLVNASTELDTSSLTLSWESEDTFYFVVVENLEASPTPINQTPFPGGPRGQLRSFRSRPTRDNSYTIRRFDLTYLGEHRARIYKVNREYANLYAFGQQDSRNLNEPETNVKNGLGVFAGFSNAAVHFRVIKQ